MNIQTGEILFTGENKIILDLALEVDNYFQENLAKKEIDFSEYDLSQEKLNEFVKQHNLKENKKEFLEMMVKISYFTKFIVQPNKKLKILSLNSKKAKNRKKKILDYFEEFKILGIYKI